MWSTMRGTSGSFGASLRKKTPEPIMLMPMGTINKCYRCGATSYKPIIKRDSAGGMRPSGIYQCVNCKMEFTSVNEWRFAPQAPKEAPKGCHQSI